MTDRWMPGGFRCRVDDARRFVMFQDDLGTVQEADFLVGRSLLQKAPGGDYIFHDLMLDFARMECDCGELEGLVKEALERQRKYLGRLAVLRRYGDVGEHLHTGLYALMSLWRSLEELSGTDRLGETYNESLDKIADTETESAGRAFFGVAGFFELAVSSVRCVQRRSRIEDSPSLFVSEF